MSINAETTAVELAALVSQALEGAGIKATLSGGGAVSIYTHNRYESSDLDFVTTARRGVLGAALQPLGFRAAPDGRHFAHPNARYVLEFPAGPLEFGDRIVHDDEIPRHDTPWGPLRVITPTQCVMDRLAAFWHWRDRQSWDQAVMVAAHQPIDYDELTNYAASEGADASDIVKLRASACLRD